MSIKVPPPVPGHNAAVLWQQALALSDADMERFFGGTKPALTEVAEDTWADYKAENP